MNILFFNGYNVSPHLDTELEIAFEKLNNNHHVYFVFCNGNLETCYENPSHEKLKCELCASRKLNALRLIKHPNLHIVELPDNNYEGRSMPEFHSIDDLKAFQYDGVDIGMGVASSLISIYRDHRLNVINYKHEVKKSLRTAMYVNDVSKKLLDQIKPDEVYLFNGRFLEIRPMMRQCEKRNIAFYTHERGGGVNRYLVRKNSTPHSLDLAHQEMNFKWETASDERETIGRRFFIDRRNRIQQSWYVFTDKQKKGHLPEGFDRSRKNIVIFNSSMDEYEGLADFKNLIYKDDNQGIERILESFEYDSSVHFYLRVHPNLSGLDNSQMTEIKSISLRFSNLTLIEPDEIVDTYELMEASSVIMVFGSTMGAEACFWNKPVILLSRAFYEKLDGFYKPSNHDEVVQLLNSPNLSPLDNNDILKYGYWLLNWGMPFRYYVPDSLTSGKFLGKEIKPSIGLRIKSRLKSLLKK